MSTKAGADILSSGVPAALGALVTNIVKFSRLTFAGVVAPALDYAMKHFLVYGGLYGQERFGIHDLQEKLRS